MHPDLWLAFGDLSGTDMWRNQGRVVQERFEQPLLAEGRQAFFAGRNRYETPAGPTLAWELAQSTWVQSADRYVLLWDSTFFGPAACRFGDQEEMGLGVRVAKSLEVRTGLGGRRQDSEERQRAAVMWGEAGRLVRPQRARCRWIRRHHACPKRAELSTLPVACP